MEVPKSLERSNRTRAIHVGELALAIRGAPSNADRRFPDPMMECFETIVKWYLEYVAYTLGQKSEVSFFLLWRR